MGNADHQTQLIVLGAGPGGYAAAFYAADLGIDVTLVDDNPRIGGTCLHRGCIPSKALLQMAHVLEDAKQATKFGIEFAKPVIHLNKIGEWKNNLLVKLSDGLKQLAKARKINVVQGTAMFKNHNTIAINTHDGVNEITFQNAIIATGSRPTALPGNTLKSDRLIYSAKALELNRIPKNMLVIGGGYIGLELASVYAAFGTRITVVEMLDTIIPQVDKDISRILLRQLSKKFAAFIFKTRVTKITEDIDGLHVSLAGLDESVQEIVFDQVLVSIGRVPNTNNLGLENLKLELDNRGFVCVNPSRQTSEPNIYAIGDVTGNPMLAHKASAEARVAVEHILNNKAVFAPRAIPSVIYTNPQVATCGLTEAEAKEKNINISIARFPWMASGRALTLDAADGITKLIIDKHTQAILGAAIVGPHAGDLISEITLAIELRGTVKDLKNCIHPHPTLSETIMEAAEAHYGHCTHLYRPLPKK